MVNEASEGRKGQRGEVIRSVCGNFLRESCSTRTGIVSTRRVVVCGVFLVYSRESRGAKRKWNLVSDD